MNKAELLSTIEEFRNEISGNSVNCRLIDPWFISRTDKHAPPMYKKLTIGYEVNSDDEYLLIIKTYSKNRKTNRLAKEIICRVGEGRVERMYVGKSRPKLLIGHIRPFNKKNLPVSLGSSVSNGSLGYGTIGGFVKTNEGKKALLTCGHVLYDKSYKQVYSPAFTKKNILQRNKRYVGDIDAYHYPKMDIKNLIDASTAVLLDHVPTTLNKIQSECQFKGKQVQPISHDVEIGTGELAYKIGAKLPFKVGSFAGKHYDVKINGFLFDELYAINDKIGIFAKPGDSGSLAFIEQNGSLFGLGIVVGEAIISGGRSSVKQTYICPLSKILDILDVSFV